MAKTIGKNTGSSIRMIALVTVALMALSIPASACTYSLGDRVWEDKDKDGIQESGEVGLPNVQVVLYRDGQNLVSTTTDSNGMYIFKNLEEGYYSGSGKSCTYHEYKYQVQFILPKGYVFTEPNQGSGKFQDYFDSDADKQTGMTGIYSLKCGSINTVDAGMYYVENTEIPEYPTVALPVAAILGLAFVFMRKQE